MSMSDLQQDTDRLRQRADRADRTAKLAQTEDVVIDGVRRLLLRSPNGTYWSVTANDDGTLSTTNAGSSL